MSDVVLVYPRSDSIEPAMNHFYLPLALLNSVIYVEKEFSVKIIDQRTDRNWRKSLFEELGTNPLCVGLTALTGDQIAYVLEAIRLVKNLSNVPIVLGGIHASILPEQTLMNPYVDFIIEGEGELSFYELVRALANKKPLKDVKGLWYKDGGVIKNNPLPDFVDLNSLPDPPYHLVSMENYILRFNKQRMFAMETSRGCPYRCAFCFVQKTFNQKKWRYLRAENILAKIKRIKKEFGVDGVEFIDLESFIIPARMLEFCELLIKDKVDIFWNTMARIPDILKLDKDAIRLLEKSRLRRLGLGVESGSERMLKLIKKDITLDQVLEVSEKLSKTNIPPLFSFMTGLPTETEEDLKKTTDLIMRLLEDNPRAKVSIFHCFRPLPGTELYDLSIQHGLQVPSRLEEWNEYNMEKADFPWISARMQKKIFALNFLSLFIDRKFEEVDNLAVQLFGKSYKFLARYRFKYHDFRLLIEPYLKSIFIKLRR